MNVFELSVEIGYSYRTIAVLYISKMVQFIQRCRAGIKLDIMILPEYCIRIQPGSRGNQKG